MPPRDNSDALDRWRAADSAARHERVRTALKSMIARNEDVTFRGLAMRADVSRSWLHDSIFAEEIRAAANRPRPARAARHKPASVESLRSRLQDALHDNRRLREELAETKRQLALALGANRDDKLSD